MAKQSKRHMGQKVYSTDSVDSITIEANGRMTTKSGFVQDLSSNSINKFTSFNACLTPMTAGFETAEFSSEFQPNFRPNADVNWWFCKVYAAAVSTGGTFFVTQIATDILGNIYTRYSSNSGSTWSAWVAK
jgi:hypothetical protein